MALSISENPKYRPEINGLRAVAVLLVLLFHLEVKTFHAGFLGVDVFLVISGYLITRNILNDLSAGKFSFYRFYTRRFKRLFPALFVTMSICLCVGYLTLPPANLERLGKVVISGLFWFSNYFFLGETGYFDTESAFKPLLHIWSLSIEEQFYFVWPFGLWLIYKIFRKGFFYIIILLALGSIILCHLNLTQKPEKVFYLLQYRMFEFLLGALCIRLEQFRIRSELMREFFVLIGLFLIVFSSIVFTALTPMPGLWSLVPCIGAMLVIYAGETRFSGILLKNPLMELLGKTSYSIYLIHWPLIVYYKYYTLSDLSSNNKIVLGVVSILLAYFMWKFIENSFRASKYKLKRIDAVWIWMPVGMCLLGYSARLVYTNHGYPQRYSEEFTMTEEEINYNRNKYWENINSDKEILNGSDSHQVIVMGNSFAVDLIYALRKTGLNAKITSLPTTHRCFNFGTMSVNEEDKQFCSEIKQLNFGDSSWRKTEAVYLMDHWPKANLAALKLVLEEIRTLTKAPIYVFGPKMVFSKPIPYIVHSCKSASTYAINKFAQEYAEIEDRDKMNKLLIAFFDQEKFSEKGIYYIDVLALLKNEQGWFEIVSSQTKAFLYFDPSHFTDQGTVEFGQSLKVAHPEIFSISN